MSAPADNASAALPLRITYADRAAPAAASAAAAAVSKPLAAAAASAAPPLPIAAELHTMDDISAKFNRDSVIRVGSLMLTFNDAEKGYSLNTVRGVEKDGVRFREISGSEQRVGVRRAAVRSEQ